MSVCLGCVHFRLIGKQIGEPLNFLLQSPIICLSQHQALTQQARTPILVAVLRSSTCHFPLSAVSFLIHSLLKQPPV